MDVILFDGPEWEDLLPLTYTRPVAGLRIGIDTIEEKWNAALDTKCKILTQAYIQPKYLVLPSEDYVMINGAYLPSPFLTDAVKNLKPYQKLIINDEIIAVRSSVAFDLGKSAEDLDRELEKISITTSSPLIHILYPWHLFQYNDIVLKEDFKRLTHQRKSGTISSTNQLFGDQIFLGKNVKVEGAILNSLTGPIYLDDNTEIMEGAMIRGGLALGEGSPVKMGAKLYGANTFGPHCKIGGEVTNSIFQGYSNKGHDGYLGNSVIGEWCNFGADTNSSNLKNNYKKVSIYNHKTDTLIDSGQQFLGLIMGDHSKTGINTMLNTGTVVGVSSNIFGAGFPPTHVPSFTWGNDVNPNTYLLDKALEVAKAVMARRNIEFSDEDKEILTTIFELTSKYRK